MPRRRNRQRKRRQRRSNPRGMNAPRANLAIESERPVLESLLPAVLKCTPRPETKEEWFDLKTKTLKVSESKEPPLIELGVLRSVFKADHPYRTKLGYHSTLTTSSAGLLNTNWPVSAISSAGEWTSIDALFDEVFIHSMTIKFIPRNRLDGAFAFTPTGQTAPVIEQSSTTTTSTIWNAGIIMASLFVGAGAYTSASSMVANPNHKTAHTSKPFAYAWRNNTRFDTHGLQIATANSQGWCLIGSVGSAYGGYVQFRAVNDVVLGTGASAVTLADMETVWDVSFRSRA